MDIKKRLAKTIGSTIASLAIVYLLFAITQSGSMGHEEMWLPICLGIVILCSLFYCTFTIIDEIKEVRKGK